MWKGYVAVKKVIHQALLQELRLQPLVEGAKPTPQDCFLSMETFRSLVVQGTIPAEKIEQPEKALWPVHEAGKSEAMQVKGFRRSQGWQGSGSCGDVLSEIFQGAGS